MELYKYNIKVKTIVIMYTLAKQGHTIHDLDWDKIVSLYSVKAYDSLFIQP